MVATWKPASRARLVTRTLRMNAKVVRDPVTALMKMLRPAKTAAMREPQRGVAGLGEFPVRAVRDR